MPREPRLGAEGGADADAEMEVDNLAAARRGLLWLDGARAAWGREGDGACIDSLPPLPPRQQRALEA